MLRRNAKPPLNWQRWLLVSSNQNGQSGRHRHDVRRIAGAIPQRKCVSLQIIAALLGIASSTLIAVMARGVVASH